MPSRRSPVTIARAVGSKSSTTSTRMTTHSPSPQLACAFSMPGRRSQLGPSQRHRAETGPGVQPASKGHSPTEKGDRMSDATIEVSGLRKRFGPTLALDGMTFTVSPGQVTGFIGPNGAGKSTTMRVILGLDAPDEGTAVISGRPYRSLRRPLTQVGALLDAAALQPSRTARNHLLWLAHSQGLGARRVDEVIAQAGLEKAAKRKAGGFSLGMRQ